MLRFPTVRHIAATLAVASFCVLAGAPTQTEAIAAEASQKGRDVFHCLEEHSVLIPNLQDHSLTLFICSGTRFIEGGEVATFQVYGGADYQAGSGREIAYQVVEYQDESSQVLKFSGTRTPDGDETATFEGTFEVISGTGRFADAGGNGTFKGRSIGNNGYLDWTME